MYDIYQIEEGDTLEIIAQKTNTTVDNLRDINRVINVVPGAYIIVPTVENELFEMYTVRQGDNLYKIAQEIGINAEDLIMLNGLNKDDYIYPNQQLIIPKQMIDIYITKDGDTVDTLVRRFNTDYETLINENRKLMIMPDQLVILKKMNKTV